MPMYMCQNCGKESPCYVFYEEDVDHTPKYCPFLKTDSVPWKKVE